LAMSNNAMSKIEGKAILPFPKLERR